MFFSSLCSLLNVRKSTAKFSKLENIKSEVFSSEEKHDLEIIQPFDKNLANFNFVFESEVDRNVSNKGKYYHFAKTGDNSFWTSVVKTKGSAKSTKLVLGSLTNPNHRLCKIRRSMIRVTRRSGNDTFIKKNIEDDEPQACGNTRQYSRAALDILKHLGCIEEITSKGRSPIYAITEKIFMEGDQVPQDKLPRQTKIDEFRHTKDVFEHGN